jgi:hypothetical protein
MLVIKTRKENQSRLYFFSSSVTDDASAREGPNVVVGKELGYIGSSHIRTSTPLDH